MTAATQNRKYDRSYLMRKGRGLAGTDIFYQGTLLAVNTAGALVPAADTIGYVVVGVCTEYLDNSAGATDKWLEYDIGVFKFADDSDALVAADVGRICYVADDQTITAAASGSVVAAGIVQWLEGGEAWVSVGMSELVLQGTINNDEVVTSGAISLYTRTSRISVTGTAAYTLADGLYEGQRKTLYCAVAATTPDGTITPVTLDGGTTLDMDAVSESYELEWHDTGGWHVVHLVGGAIS